MRIPIGDQVANRGQAVGNRFLGNHFAIYTDPFAKRDEVRGGEEAGAIAPRATDRIDHGANGAFAVCACDVDDSKCRGASLGERRAFDAANAATTFVEQTPDVFQAKFDPKALKAIKPGERLPIVHGVIEKYPSNRLISSRIFFRCTIMSIKPCSWRNSAV